MPRGVHYNNPHAKKKGSGGGGGRKILGFSEKINDRNRPVFSFFIKRNTPEKDAQNIILLDEVTTKNDKDLFMIDWFENIHYQFEMEGDWRHSVVCPYRSPTEACPICVGGNCNKESRLYAIATVLLVGKRTREFDGKTYTYEADKQLLLIPENDMERINTLMTKIKKKGGSTFGQEYSVTRGESQTSSRLGDWFPEDNHSYKDLVARFQSTAEAYGVTIEQFLAPFDYEEMFKPLPMAEYERIAATLKAEAGVASAAASKGSGESASPMVKTIKEMDDDEVPF